MDQKKLLLDIICTSKNVSGFTDSRPELDRAAKIFCQIENSYKERADEIQNRYDGSGEEDVSNDQFQKKKQTLQQIVDERTSDVERSIPSNDNYDTYTLELDAVENDELRSFGIAFKQYRGSHKEDTIQLLDFPESAVVELIKPLNRLGEAATKLEALEKVENEVALHGYYQFHEEFDSVPDACEYYREKLVDKENRDLLKEKIKKYARIYDKGKVLEDWEKINKRINAWWHHEKNKYNK